MVEVNQDVANNATTELLEGQKITGELTMKLKTLLHSCTVDYVDIVLYYYDTDRTINQIETEICNRKDFHDFIETYGNSVVSEWKISSEYGRLWMLFSLQNLVKDEKQTVKPTIKPTTKDELKEIIEKTIKEEGCNCDLNFIDVSNITDMSCLFFESKFNGDISKWDVSNVTDMSCMFFGSQFNGDISDWNVKNVRDISYMFTSSEFSGDISKWNILKVKYWKHIFDLSPLNTNPPEWY